MRFWLYITTLDNWDISKEKRIIGVGEKHTSLVSKISEGDKGIIYIKCHGSSTKIKDPIVVASFTIGTYFFDTNQLFFTPKNMISQTFPNRYNLQKLDLFKNPVKMKKNVQDLTFLKNKERWGMHLMGRVMIELTKSDYNVIIDSSKK